MQSRTMLELLAHQIRLQEARAGRRAVGACVALPRGANTPEAHARIRQAVRGPAIQPFELEVIEIDGDPRVLTVDFELLETP